MDHFFQNGQGENPAAVDERFLVTPISLIFLSNPLPQMSRADQF